MRTMHSLTRRFIQQYPKLARSAFLLIWMLIGAGMRLTPVSVQAHDEIPQDGQSQDAILQSVGFDQNLGAQIPLNLHFKDEEGNTVALSDYFQNKPVVLSLGYYNCTSLCPMVFKGMVTTLSALKFTMGKDYEVISISIDPKETPAIASETKSEYMADYGRPGAEGGWHFLTGDHESIDQLAQIVGFRYAYDAEHQVYAHAAGIIVLTPQGKVSSYFYGLDYSPKDVRLGLVEASKNDIGSVKDQLLLRCFHYDPVTGKYGVAIQFVMRVAGIATVLLLAGLVVLLIRQEKNHEIPTVS